MQTFLLVASALLGACLASYDPYLNVDMDKLYRMQLLANAIDDYIPSDQLAEEAALEDEGQYSYWPSLEDMVPGEVDQQAPEEVAREDQAVYNDPMYSGPQPRDEEHLEHSNLHGFQSMTGGTAEGAQKQVKSDKLPAYCNPPNPCPVGKTEAENCVENFENTAENNERLLSMQECSCDTEHMFKCPAGSKTVSTKGESDSQQMALNKVMGELAEMEQQEQNLENNAQLSAANKRFTVVAKKSPHIIHKRSEGQNYGNPYFKGVIKAMAAKKSPSDSKLSFRYFDELKDNKIDEI